jgi:hypothetical protein
MIIPALHRDPRPVDSQVHRRTTVKLPITSWAHLAGTNALFVTAAECAQVACDYPIVFVKAGDNPQGGVDYAPIAVLGLKQGENLYVDQGSWRAMQLPSLMGTYPFCIARSDAEHFAVCLDAAYDGLSEAGEGERLFDDAGQATEFATRVKGELERLEAHVQGTRQAVRRLAELGLLVDKRFDATLPDGSKLAVEGFFMVDEDKLKALPDATLLELHRNGLMRLVHAHWVSLGQMRRLLTWRIERGA